MPRKLTPIAVAISMVLGAVPASAEFYTGNKYYERCLNKRDDFCTGFLMGVIDALEDLKFMCVPEGVSGFQALDIVMKYMREKPQERHGAAADIAFKALKAVYPCK